jgi:rod shape-determining protein MreD
MKAALNRGLRNGIAGRKIGPFEWLFLPAVLSILGTLILGASVQPFGYYLPEPVLPFILAFTWPLIRPSVIAPVLVFLLGLFLDLYWGSSLGLWALSLSVLFGLMTVLRPYVTNQEPFFIFWVFFGVLVLMYMIMILFTLMDTGTMARLSGALEQILATCLFFPTALVLIERYAHSSIKFQ